MELMKTLVVGFGLFFVTGVFAMNQTIKYVGPFSPQAYQAAQMIKDGGNGAPFALPIIEAARQILNLQDAS